MARKALLGFLLLLFASPLLYILPGLPYALFSETVVALARKADAETWAFSLEFRRFSDQGCLSETGAKRVVKAGQCESFSGEFRGLSLRWVKHVGWEKGKFVLMIMDIYACTDDNG